MTCRVTCLVCLVGTLTVLACRAGLANAVINPGFENPLGAEWTVVYAGGSASDFTVSGRDTASKYTGAYGVHFQTVTDDANKFAYLKQTVSGLTPGGTYGVSAYVKHVWDRTDKYYGYLEAVGGGPAQVSTISTAAWTQKTVTQIADANGRIEIRLWFKKTATTVGKTCDVYFDDVSCVSNCTPPAAPTGVSASPSTIDPGQSSTLSASVAGGCTVDWFTAGCGGTMVGSGTTLVVSPVSTTTYYARAREIAGGCVSTACGSVTLTVNAAAHLPIRPSDPIVLTGANLPSFLGQVPGSLVAFKYLNGWQQIPIQVDERAVVDFSTVYHGYVEPGVTSLFYTDANTWTGPDPDPAIDSNDEIVFMASDLGSQPPYLSYPAGVVAGTGVRVTVTDPADPTAYGYAYLFRQDGSLSPGAGRQYVSYNFVLSSGDYKSSYNIASGPNPENSTVTSPYYSHRFTDRWKNVELRIYAGGASGVDILDRHKNLFAPGNCTRSEDTFCNGEGAFVTNKSGPVRAIRSYLGANSGPLTQRDHICYARRQDINTYLRVHQIGGIMDFFDYSPAASGMSYRNNNVPMGVTIDGSPDTVAQGQIHWELVNGPQGGLTIVSNIFTNIAGIAPTSYYLDDAAPSETQCTGDAYAYGSSGTWINQTIACTDPALACSGYLNAQRVLYYDAPGATAADAVTRHTWAEQPLNAACSVWQDSAPPVIASVAVNPLWAAAHDSISVTVNTADDTGVASVTANGVSLTRQTTGEWTGTIPAESGLGTHTVTVTATDGSGRTATDSSKSYETQRVIGASNRSLRDLVAVPASSEFLFTAWGRVTRIDDNAFLLDDGSGKPVEVHAAGHGMSTGWQARARGILDPSHTPPILFSAAQQVNRLD